ncbi:MAG: aminoglycoside 3'-phosphotransferase/choline kinase family protein [Verrucomicrobia bacterium]|nr:aminoglycoside 3'-phosphotransferase/choline kinase family protein [Verrucomicrobiota bacterium]
MRLPLLTDRTALAQNRKNLGAFEPGLRHILHLCGLADAATAVLANTHGGSMPVFAVNDDLILKLFPEICREFYDNELSSLRLLAGRPPFAIPQIRACGTVETWHYLLMTRVPGVQLATLWPTADDTQRATLLESIGAATAALHRLHTPTPAETAAWRSFMTQQVANVIEHHSKTGLSENLLAQLPAYLAPALDRIATAPVTFLHTELMLEHIFVDPTQLTVTSMIDFEPSTVGAPEYDFTGVPVFLTLGRPPLLRSFLRGYGYPWNPATSPRLLMSYLILHRYSNLGWFQTFLGDRRPAEVTRLEELEKLWWSA